MAVVRSPHAHARITAVETDEAAGLRGVTVVVASGDLPHPVPRVPAVALFSGVRAVTHPLLADAVVRYVGEPIAVVLAESRYAAEDAVDRVRVRYEPLTAVVDVDEALRPEAPVLHPELGSNLVFTHETYGGDPDAALDGADVIVEATIEQPRLAAMPLEGRGVVAVYDAPADRLTMWLSTQVPHGARATISSVLEMAQDRVRVIAPDVGGGFGAKGSTYPEEILAALLSRRLGRPVKWVEDRLENLRTMTQGRGQRARLRAAATRDGTVLAVTGEILVDLGAYCLSVTGVIPLRTPLVGLGAYRIPHVRFRLRGIATTKAPTGPYRGAGRPEGAFYIERLMDLLAARLGIDPAELRRRNFIERFPYKSPTGLTYDSGDYETALDRALALSGYGRWRDEQARRRRDGGRPIGIGLATWIETTAGGEMWESGAVRIEPTGRVTVLTGSSPHGQGLATALSQIAADSLGVTPEEVTVVHGDTGVVPAGIGTFASRSLSIGGSAVVQAAAEVRDKIVAIASRLLEAAPADVVLQGGAAHVRGVPGRAVTLAAVAGAAIPDGVSASVRFTQQDMATPSGAHAAVVEIDPETGTVTVLRYVACDDCGRVVNPLLVEGQVHGSLAQGLAQALLERVEYGSDGQPLTGTLMDYQAPTAADLPEFETATVETPSPLNPLGAKGIGESGTIGAPPALVNAVLDALRPSGVETLDLPLAPDRVWGMLRSSTAQSSTARPSAGRSSS